MKIEITNHAIKRTVERVWKVSNWIQAREYLIDKFLRLKKGENVWFKNKWYVRDIKQEDWNYFLWNSVHRFIYGIKEEGVISIITYHVYNKKKQKIYINSELKRIEKLFIK